jgi:hypothetical protein
VGVVKKTVAIHPVIDKYIRMTWALLIEAGYDATYSTALNLMLLAAILEISRGDLSRETAEILQSFLRDVKTVEELKLVEQVSDITERIMREIVKAATERK